MEIGNFSSVIYGNNTFHGRNDVNKITHETLKIIDNIGTKTKSGNEALNDTLYSLIDSYEPKLQENDAQRKEQLKISKSLTQLQTTVNSFYTTAKSINTTLSSPIKTMAATNVPVGVIIQASSAANAGNHTIAVDSIASKQRIIIQSKDIFGNQVPFPLDPTIDVTGLSSGAIAQNSSFLLTRGSSMSTTNVIANITLPSTALTLQDIADSINTQIHTAAVSGGYSPNIKAYAVYDNVGGSLIIESINPGTDSDFYLPLNDSSTKVFLNNLSIVEQPEAVMSVDLYGLDGNPFLDPSNITTAQQLQPFVWRIGDKGKVVEFTASDVTSVYAMAERINADGDIKANLVHLEGGTNVVLRVTGNLNFTLGSLYDGYKDSSNASKLSTQCARVSTSCDTMVKIDNIPYNLADSNSITNPTVDIAELNVTAPIAYTRFNIAENTGRIKSAFTNLVESINSLQQFAAQNKNAEISMEEQSKLNKLQSEITSLTYVRGGISFNSIGIYWDEYIPTSIEAAAGAVEARYLKINDAQLNDALQTNLKGVKSLFAKSSAITPANNVAIAINSLGSAQSTFNLNVSYDGTNFTVYTDNYGTGPRVNFNYQVQNSSTLAITGSGIFAGLNLDYSHVDGSGFVSGMETSTITLTNSPLSSIILRMPSLNAWIERKLNQTTSAKKELQKKRGEIEENLQSAIKRAEMQATNLKRQEKDAEIQNKIIKDILFGTNKG